MACVYGRNAKQFSKLDKILSNDFINFLLHILKQASGSDTTKDALSSAIAIQSKRFNIPKDIENYLYEKVVG